jgi:hypothetical protein
VGEFVSLRSTQSLPRRLNTVVLQAKMANVCELPPAAAFDFDRESKKEHTPIGVLVSIPWENLFRFAQHRVCLDG